MMAVGVTLITLLAVCILIFGGDPIKDGWCWRTVVGLLGMLGGALCIVSLVIMLWRYAP